MTVLARDPLTLQAMLVNMPGFVIPPGGVLVFDHVAGRVYVERGPWRWYL